MLKKRGTPLQENFIPKTHTQNKKRKTERIFGINHDYQGNKIRRSEGMSMLIQIETT